MFNKIINEVLKNLPKMSEWLSPNAMKYLKNVSWNDAINNLHKPLEKIRIKNI